MNREDFEDRYGSLRDEGFTPEEVGIRSRRRRVVVEIFPDYIVSGGGTVYIITAQNQRAARNIKDNVQEGAYWLGNGLVVEHRYIGPLVEQLREEGWEVL